MATRRPLTRDKILQAALRLADEGGIEALSMRKLARELGVEAMSLYNHVANKTDLVDGIVDLALAEIDLPDDEGPWDVAVRRCAVSAHEAFLRHPWACSLVMSSGRPLFDSPRLRYMEWLLGRLRGGGLSADLTYHGYHALDSHILGFTLWQLGHSGGLRQFAGDQDVADVLAGFMRELRAHDYQHLVEHAEQHLAAPEGDGARQFAFGLDLILDGLKRAHAAESRHSRARVTK
jgi:AcrR family transcriptional regulator